MTFVTRRPTPYQIEQIKAVCDDYVAIGEDHFEAFLKLIQPGDIVVLDNYFFDTAYQREIKAKGCKLVCIDDMHDKHYVADMVINHGLNNSELFSVEPYTLLCLGLDWALLRRPFLTAQPLSVREKGHIVVSFGGSDPHNLTYKVCRLLADKPEIRHMTAVVGDAYDKTDSLQGFDQVEVCKNLAAEEMADLFCRVEFAVLPTSTVCIEALACGCPVAGGYYVDNQTEYYKNFAARGYIAPLGDLSRESLQIEVPTAHPSTSVSLVADNYCKMFSALQLDIIDYTELNEKQSREVHRARNLPEIRQFMANPNEFSFESHAAFIERLKSDPTKRYWAVFRGDEFVGGFNAIGIENGRAERGLFVVPEFQGTGTAEALEFYFERLMHQKMGIDRLRAEVKTNNPRSLAYHHRIGYRTVRQEGEYVYLERELKQ